jgi:hypothetical protein
MDWTIITLNITFASAAALLCVLSWNTMKNIRYLNVGRSFWAPVFLSGLLFSISSIITILNELVLSATIAVEIGQVTELVAFCSLSVGVYCYSRMIRKNLPEKYIVPEDNSVQNDKMGPYVVSTQSSYKRTIASNNLGNSTSSGCSHELGYLRTFPVNASLPEECLSCGKVMECKKS